VSSGPAHGMIAVLSPLSPMPPEGEAEPDRAIRWASMFGEESLRGEVPA